MYAINTKFETKYIDKYTLYALQTTMYRVKFITLS